MDFEKITFTPFHLHHMTFCGHEKKTYDGAKFGHEIINYRCNNDKEMEQLT